MKKNCKHLLAIFVLVGFAALACASTASSPPPQQQTRPPAQQQQPSQPRQQQGNQTTTQQQQTPVQPASQFWTGNGGRGMRLGIIVPQSQGLSENQEYLPAMIQGILVSNFSQYSAITVLDRASLDRVIIETLDPIYIDSNLSESQIVQLGHVAQVGHMLTGNIIRTSTGFSLHFTVTETTPQTNVVASFSGTSTVAELDNHSTIHRATIELLTQMGVQLTARARTELGRASMPETMNAQAALARGVIAERQGFEMAALSYYLQAVEFDPLLFEAEDRLNIITASFARGNVGADARADIQWRNQWIGRLRETEEFVAQFLRQSPAFYLVYSFSDNELAIDFARNTVTKVVEIRSLPEPTWFMAVNQLTSTVRSALLATGRAETWGINWPNQSISTPSPFAGSNATYAVVVEILSATGTSIARQTVNIPFDWFVPAGAEQTGIIVPRVQFNASTVSFPNVDVNIIDDLSIRITSVGNRNAETATSQLGIRVLPKQEYDRIPSVVDNGLRTDNLRQFDIRFSQSSNRINGYSGSSTSIVIPFGVSLIDGNSGLREKSLSSVRFPSSLIRIGDRALQQNRLTVISIPDNVTSIGDNAFNNNPLTRVNIGANVRLDRHFYGISGLPHWGDSFVSFYNENGRRAGTYTIRGQGSFGVNLWAFSSQ